MKTVYGILIFIFMTCSLQSLAVVNGIRSGVFPFSRSPMVLLHLNGPQSHLICSAVAISDRTIITAAHCIEPAGKLNAVEFYTAKPLSETVPFTKVVLLNTDIARVISHPKYPKNFDQLTIEQQRAHTRYDIGLILLKKPISKEKIRAELYLNATDFQEDIKKNSLLIAGYGANHPMGKNSGESVGFATFEDPQTFLEDHTGIPIAEAFDSTHNEVVAVSGETSFMCFGDSGGGLFMFPEQLKKEMNLPYVELSKWTLLGINSWILGTRKYPNLCSGGSIHPTFFDPQTAGWLKANMK